MQKLLLALGLLGCLLKASFAQGVYQAPLPERIDETLSRTTLTVPRQQKQGTIALLGTVEYRNDSFDELPSWQDVMKKVREEMPDYVECFYALPACTSKALQGWMSLIRINMGGDVRLQLHAVNRFVNQWGYRSDSFLYSRLDYWASPLEFFALSGDCEDYAIAKYVSLRLMGWPPESLRMVVVRDNYRPEVKAAHAVLAVYVGEEIFILDKLYTKPMPQEVITERYTPYFSVNEQSRWTHVPAFQS